MKKGLKKFLLVILALFLFYQVSDYIWQRDRERKVERVIVAMQNSVDTLEGFLRENEDDLAYLLTKCIEDEIIFYHDSVQFVGGPGNPKEIAVEQEILSRRDRLIRNLPSSIHFYHIYDTGLYLNSEDSVFETMCIGISSPSFTEGSVWGSAGSIATIELDHTWTVDVVVYDYWDRLRASKVLEKGWAEEKKERNVFLFAISALFLIYLVYHFFWQRNCKKEMKRVIAAMQNSVDELEGFLRNHEDDLEYLVTKCIEDDLIICTASVESAGPDSKEIAAEPEILSRRDRLISNLPRNMDFFSICSSGINLYNSGAVFGTLHLAVSSPPFTKDGDGRVVGSIGAIELNHTWTIDVATYTHNAQDYLRACKIFERMRQAPGQG